ncbi:protein containing ATP-binding region, ATPase-like protein, partial [Candidatus Magnetobacterium bavaricum]
MLLWSAVYLSVRISEDALERSIIANHIDIDTKYVALITHELSDNVDFYREYSIDTFFRQFVDESNVRFDNIDNVGDYIDKIDREWIKAPKNIITPFMADLINNPLSIRLKEQLEYVNKKHGYKLHAEVFLTNKYGANVAQTGKTSDY